MLIHHRRLVSAGKPALSSLQESQSTATENQQTPQTSQPQQKQPSTAPSLSTHHITGTVPATVSDFKITQPSFLTVPIKNEIPVKVDILWHGQ